MREFTRPFSGQPIDKSSESSFLIRRAIFESLVRSSILIDDLPESRIFDRTSLQVPDPIPKLNFQQKLGHLYEEALATLLNHSPKYEVLESNLPIRRNQHDTIGEIDFLLREEGREELIHLELATKFYLAVETDDGLILPGPDARDNYPRKLSRLREHQLTLAQRFREHLPEAYRDSKIISRHLVLGTLFDHIEATCPSTPEFLHPEARRGKWLEIRDLWNHFNPGTPLRILPKPLWPVPAERLETIELENFSPTENFDRCQMVLTPAGDPLFITPNSYPIHQGAGIR